MIESLLSVLTWIENTRQYHKAPSHFFVVRLLPYILFSYFTLLERGGASQPPKNNKTEPQTKHQAPPNPLKTPNSKPSTKPLSVLRVHSLRREHRKEGLAIYWCLWSHSSELCSYIVDCFSSTFCLLVLLNDSFNAVGHKCSLLWKGKA